MDQFQEINNRYQYLQRKLVEKLKTNTNIYESTLLMLGLSARATSLYDALKQTLELQNPYAFIILYRSQIETLATINYVLNKPDSVRVILFGNKKQDSKNLMPNILT